MSILNKASFFSKKSLQSANGNFDVHAAFYNLESGRQMVLCDHLFNGSIASFERAVKLLWPLATSNDAKGLERMIRSRIKAAA
ncbi:MAG: hypothetical protein GC136_04310 [Alphaproteobacteria bacterium]|nr:hypothetical protein [Alphaproteobacteria bacterium]